jgi:hypothetical protein
MVRSSKWVRMRWLVTARYGFESYTDYLVVMVLIQ